MTDIILLSNRFVQILLLGDAKTQHRKGKMKDTNYSAQTYKEIYGQPESFQAILDTLPEITSTLDKVFAETYDELIFTGCGTSLYLAQTSAYLFRALNNTPAIAVPCSELIFFPENYLKGKHVLVLPITRKSYTSEVRMAIDHVHQFPGVRSLAITCDRDSAQYNEDYILAPNTDEDSVIMTRSFTAMVFLAEILSMHVSGHDEMISEMKDYPEAAEQMLKEADALCAKIISEYPQLNLFITLGQGAFYGIANECMNKMKEMSISNSEAYYSMEYRHGPMSLVDENTLLINLSNEKTTQTDDALMAQMKSYGGITCGVGTSVDKMSNFDYRLVLHHPYHELQAAALIGIVGQMLGYHLSLHKQINADTPRHLSQAIVLNK
jgi:glucosamine--fructose-6-phosphate aminotransferase (isomerizing)